MQNESWINSFLNWLSLIHSFLSAEMEDTWFNFADLEGVSVRHLYFTLIAAIATRNPFAIHSEAFKLAKVKGMENESYRSSRTNKYDRVGLLVIQKF